MVHPRAWLPTHGDAPGRRAAVLGGAIVLSLLLHAGLPFVRWNQAEAVSESAIVVELVPPPPLPLPEAEELVPSPLEEDVEAPPVPDAPAAQPAAPTALEEPSPPEPSPPEPSPPEPSPSQPPPAPEPPAAAPGTKPTPEENLRAERLAELERRREERMAERERRRAEREARRNARREQQEGGGGKKGGAPPTGDWQTGKPSATWLCTAQDRGTELHVLRERPLSEWIAIVPTVFVGFVTRPDLGGYLGDTRQVVARDRVKGLRRLGLAELSLPNEVLQLDLEEPRGVRLAVGRLDARCLVGFKYATGLFPFTVARTPVRIVDAQNNAVSALVDITFYKDAWLELASADGTPLPFKRARLKNGNAIKRNIQDHYEAARLAKGIAEVFGIDLRPKRSTPAGQKERKRAGAQEGSSAAERSKPIK